MDPIPSSVMLSRAAVTGGRAYLPGGSKLIRMQRERDELLSFLRILPGSEGVCVCTQARARWRVGRGRGDNMAKVVKGKAVCVQQTCLSPPGI